MCNLIMDAEMRFVSGSGEQKNSTGSASSHLRWQPTEVTLTSVNKLAFIALNEMPWADIQLGLI